MKQFHFKLDPILQQRKWIEEQSAVEYAQAQRKEISERARLLEIDNEHKRYVEALGRVKCDKLSIGEIQMYLNYIERIEQRKAEQMEVLKQATQLREKAYAHWQQASRDFKVLDTLREHAHERHTIRDQAEEQKFLDDVGSRCAGLSPGT